MANQNTKLTRISSHFPLSRLKQEAKELVKIVVWFRLERTC